MVGSGTGACMGTIKSLLALISCTICQEPLYIYISSHLLQGYCKGKCRVLLFFGSGGEFVMSLGPFADSGLI